MTLQEANAMLEQNQQNNLKLGVIKWVKFGKSIDLSSTNFWIVVSQKRVKLCDEKGKTVDNIEGDISNYCGSCCISHFYPSIYNESDRYTPLVFFSLYFLLVQSFKFFLCFSDREIFTHLFFHTISFFFHSLFFFSFVDLTRSTMRIPRRSPKCIILC